MPSISLTILGRDQSGAATGSAKANLESLQSARDKVSQRAEAAQNREATAAGRVRVAQQQLTEAQAKYTAESSQVLSAQERLQAAHRNLTAAQSTASRSAAQLEAAESRLKTSIESAANETERSSGRMRSALSSVGEDTGKMLGGLQSFVVGGFAGVIGGATSAILSDVTQAASQAGAAVMTELKSAAIDYNSAIENAQIGFTTMLGSGGKANAFLAQLQDFAKRTPFQFGDLTQYAQQMLGYGIKSKDILKDLSALGDAAAGSGRMDTLQNAVLAFEQMAARGKVDLGDLNQLSNAGVPALKILASQYGVSTGQMLKMISTGKVMSSDALPKLTKGIEQGTKSTAKFGGMMDKQSGTFVGAMSNIHDALDQTLSKAALPFFKVLEKGAGTLAKFAGSKAVSKWASDTSKALGGFLSSSGKALGQIFNDPKMQKSLGKLGGAVAAAFKGVGPDLQKMMPDLVKFGKDVFPAIVDGITTVAKHFPQFMSGVAAAVKELARWGPAVAKFIDWGAHIIGWLVDAVSSFQKWHEGAQVAIVKFLAGWAEGAKKFGAFIGQMEDIGKHIVEGLASGITGSFHLAIDAAKGLANVLPEWVRKLLGIRSPSTVMHTIGQQAAQGLHNGLMGSVDQIKTASGKLADAVTSAFDAKHSHVSVAMASAARRTVSAGTKRLEVLAGRRASVASRLSTAQSNLSSAKSNRSQFASGVASSDVALGDISQGYSTGGMAATLQSLLARTKQFRSALARLVKLGIDRTSYEQLVAAGVSGGGLTAATALLADTAGAKQVFGLQKQLGSAASGLGGATAGHMFDAGVNAAQGIVDGLKHGEKVIDLAMQTIAKHMVSTLRKELGIHSPSTVMHAQMGHVVAGITGGLYDRKHEVASAMGSILSVPSMGLHRALGSTSVVNGGVGGGVQIGTFVAQGGQSPYDIARELDWRSRGR